MFSKSKIHRTQKQKAKAGFKNQEKLRFGFTNNYSK